MSDEAAGVIEVGIDNGGGVFTDSNNQQDLTDDLSSIFTAEEITAKKESMAAAKAEEDRRAALTEEERKAEDDAKAAEAKKGEVPEQYADFTLPEGLQVDKELLEAFVPVAKELKLTQEQAQKVVDIQVKIAEARNAEWSKITTDWKEKARSDQEYGGDKFDASLEIAERALNTFATDDFKAMLKEYGLGNHPDMIRLFYRIGKAVKEDGMVNPGRIGEPTHDERINNFYSKSKMS